MELCQGESGGVRERLCAGRWWAWNGLSRAVDTALSYWSLRSVGPKTSGFGLGGAI